MFLKFDMNLEDVNFLYNFFGCFRDSMKFVSLSEADLGLLQHPRWSALTIITKRSILDVAAALDLSLNIGKTT